jgi:hypothetical protein
MGADLGQLVADYLQVRRALGFQLKGPASILARYLAFLDGRDEAAVTVDNALAFAQADPALTARAPAAASRCPEGHPGSRSGGTTGPAPRPGTPGPHDQARGAARQPPGRARPGGQTWSGQGGRR